MAERYWSTEEQRWVYEDEPLTARECHLRAEVLREAADAERWAGDEHRHVRQWLRDRADRIEGRDGA